MPLLLTVNCSTIAAQDIEPLLSLSLMELSKIKVTIANRVEETFVDAPSSVSVITGQEIERLGIRTLTELLNYVPGFQSYMSPHESNNSLLMARGLVDTYGKNLLLMIDGRRINDEYTGGFTYADHLLGLYNIEQVEFIRGPGSALYGSNAFSGVINIKTRFSDSARVTLGSRGAMGLAASAFAPSSNGFSSGASFQYYRDTGQPYSGLVDKHGVDKKTQDPVDVFEGRFDVAYLQTRLLLEYMSTALNDYYVAGRISNGINKVDSSRIGVYLEHDFKFASGWQGMARIGSMRHERQQRFRISPQRPISAEADWRQDTQEAQADFNYVTQSDHQIGLGAYLGASDIPAASSNVVGRFVLDESRLTAGVYAQDQFYIADDIRLTAGIRYDDYSDFGDSFNPRVALLYRWREHDSFKLMYGRAYRAPSLGDLYDKEGIVSTGNLFLEPVTVNSYEVAYLFSNRNNSAVVTWFYNDYRAFIAARESPSGDVFPDNVYDSKIQGLELELNWQYNPHWSTRAGLTWIIDHTSQEIVMPSFSSPEELAPSTYGNVQLNYRARRLNWNTSLVAHNGIAILQDQGSSMIVNSKLIFHLAPQWKFSANIRNVFDKSYNTPINRVLGQDESGTNIQELPSRGRELLFSLQFSTDS